MTLQARDSFQQGRMWTLMQWLLACRGRLATDPRDLVFAGLSLVCPEGLLIDPSLRMQVSKPTATALRPISARWRYFLREIPPLGMKAENRPFPELKPASLVESRSLIPNGLWSALQADYTTDTAEVFVNTAACLLTQSSTREILSIAARTSRPEAYTSEWWISTGDHVSLEDLPSWVPPLGSWTVCLTPSMSILRLCQLMLILS
jgi:hypothetical protein